MADQPSSMSMTEIIEAGPFPDGDVYDRIQATAAAIVAPLVVHEGTPDHSAVYVIPDGYQTKVVDLSVAAGNLERPHRWTGTRRTHDLYGFGKLLAKHATTETEVYLDRYHRSGPRVTAVINAGPDRRHPDAPRGGHRDVRIETVLDLDPTWTRWTSISGRFMDQAEFADMIDNYREDISDPMAADLLELAETLRITTTLQVDARYKRQTGFRVFSVDGDESVTAGIDGQLAVPEIITLLLRPYRDSTAREVTARLLFRVQSGKLTIAVKLLDLDSHLDRAWGDIASTVYEIADGIESEDMGDDDVADDDVRAVVVVNGSAD